MTSIHVLGAGVVGLTTAITIQEAYPNAEVKIIADFFPGDGRSIKYTSMWAGAHHVSHGADERQRVMDDETFAKMWEMSAPGSEAEHCFMRIRQTEYYAEAREGESVLRGMPEFHVLQPDELQPKIAGGVSFTTLTIDTPVYLDYLLKRFVLNGGQIVRTAVQHISQVIDGAISTPPGRSPSAVIVCLGLGAYSLGGLEDKNVYPIRGQTVLLRAPWVKVGLTISSLDGLWTYIIPRRSGDVIVGGIRDDGDWYPHARPEVTQDILARGLDLCPELVSPDYKPDTSPKPTVEDLKPLILEENCGLRPARKGGIRLEAELLRSTARQDQPSVEVPVVHNYGHGGFGYQSSWGSATMALALLKDKLPPKKRYPFKL